MVRAAQKYNRVVQVGQWQRSDPHWQDAMQFVHSGQLGKIRTVRVFSYQGWCPSIPVKPDEAVPAGVDYDMWLGPFSFHIPLVLGLCGRFDDGLGRTFTGLRIVWHERHRTGVYHGFRR